MARGEGGRLVYADLLRVAATLAVVILHLSGGWISEVPVASGAWRVFNVYDGLTRWCVPVFVMLSWTPRSPSPTAPSFSGRSCGSWQPWWCGAWYMACLPGF